MIWDLLSKKDVREYLVKSIKSLQKDCKAPLSVDEESKDSFIVHFDVYFESVVS